MTRRYWAGVMLFSLLVAGGSGWVVFTTLQSKAGLNTPVQKTVALQEVQPPVATPPPSAATTESSPVAAPADTADVPAATADETPSGSRRVLFKLKTSGKDVAIIGDFNNWFRQPLEKEGDFHTLTLTLKPGTYEYRYVIDGRRVNDPYNKNVSKKGNSVLKVKPVSSN